MEEEKPIPVNGNITPITKRPILEIKAQDWSKMTVNELLDQRSILHNRVVMASQLGNDSLIQQIQQGVLTLDSLIHQKIAEYSEKQ